MKAPNVSYLNIGPRLTLTFAFLLALIVGGNALLFWQFHLAQLQTQNLTAANQQVISVLRLQEALVSAHERLDTLAKRKDSVHLLAEAAPLRNALVERTQSAREALAQLPSSARPDSTSLPTLDAIEVTLPSQLEAVKALAASGDWDAVSLRLDHEFEPLETQTALLVANIDRDLTAERDQALANMRALQLRIALIVPATAISTFFLAAFLAWAISHRIIALRLEERIIERTRIARELHDTLLQGFISASMHVDVAMKQLPNDSTSKAALERALEVIEKVIDQGRDAVRGFRATGAAFQDLELAVSKLPFELGFEENQTSFQTLVQGTPQPLHPVICDEVYSIAKEALVNAFRHSGAGGIRIEIQYSSGQLRVLVSDDGCGIDHHVIETGRDGHWGLPGMRERARRIGASLRISSRKNAGTEVDLRVPGDIAYVHPRSSTKRPRESERQHPAATDGLT
jgi:signal transduction histidine kinase